MASEAKGSFTGDFRAARVPPTGRDSPRSQACLQLRPMQMELKLAQKIVLPRAQGQRFGARLMSVALSVLQSGSSSRNTKGAALAKPQGQCCRARFVGAALSELQSGSLIATTRPSAGLG